MQSELDSSAASLMIISSDPATQKLCKRSLSSTYHLLIAKSGWEAQKLFESHMMTIQMIVIDATLSDMLAQDWLATINRDHVLPYTILIAPDEIPAWMVESMKEGAMDIVKKSPLYDAELVLAIKQGFDYAHIRHYLLRSAEYTKNKTIQKRFSSFLNLFLRRKAAGLSVTPNEIALFFPGSDVDSELPIEAVIEAISCGDTYALVKQWKARPKLLIVEDEDNLRNSLYSEFAQECEVILAKDAEEALRLCQTHSVIDAAILDIGLPNTSGDDFLPVLKSKYPNIQVVMLTAYSEYLLIVKTVNSGAGDYLLKPHDSDELRQRVFSLLQTSLLHRILSHYMCYEGKVE